MDLQALSVRMESDGDKRAKEMNCLVEEMKSMQSIEGLVGEGLFYKDFKKFVIETHEHKESIFEDMSKLLDMRVKELTKKSTTGLEKTKDDLME